MLFQLNMEYFGVTPWLTESDSSFSFSQSKAGLCTGDWRMKNPRQGNYILTQHLGGALTIELDQHLVFLQSAGLSTSFSTIRDI